MHFLNVQMKFFAIILQNIAPKSCQQLFYPLRLSRNVGVSGRCLRFHPRFGVMVWPYWLLSVKEALLDGFYIIVAESVRY
jgi:hypothetical protein